MTEEQKEKIREGQRRNRAKREAMEQQRKAEKALIRKNLQTVLESPDATPAQRLESSKLLIELDRTV